MQQQHELICDFDPIYFIPIQACNSFVSFRSLFHEELQENPRFVEFSWEMLDNNCVIGQFDI